MSISKRLAERAWRAAQGREVVVALMESGWSQREIARQCEMHPPTVCNVFNDRLNVLTVAQLAAVTKLAKREHVAFRHIDKPTL